jgi:hypothetical protein
MHPIRRVMTWLLAVSLSYAGMLQGAQAALIGTEQVAAAAATADAAGAHARLSNLLARDDVASALQSRGVSLDEARARVAALSDAEAAQLADQIDTLPAGGTDVLGAIIFVFVLLLITDILGYTKIFPFTRSIR